MSRDSRPASPVVHVNARHRIGRLGTVYRLGATVAALATTAAIPSLRGPSQAYATTTVTAPFTTPGEQAFTVPDGVTSLHVVAIGGKGGNGEAPGLNGAGGYGAMVTTDLQVPQGVHTLYVDVGGNGGSAAGSLIAGAGGVNGGGAGGSSNGDFTTGGGGGGGGASDIRTCSVSTAPTTCVTLDSRLVVAAGGGGGGSGGSFGGPGTPGGQGGAGGLAGAGAREGTGGGAGTSTSGGSGGQGMTGGLANSGVAGVGGAGSGRNGGGGGGGGGGGAGGYFGGGGGGGGLAFGSGGGGGGSSYVGTPTTSRTIQGQTGTNGWMMGAVASTLTLTATDTTGNATIAPDTTGAPSVTISYTSGASTPSTPNRRYHDHLQPRQWHDLAGVHRDGHAARWAVHVGLSFGRRGREYGGGADRPLQNRYARARDHGHGRRRRPEHGVVCRARRGKLHLRGRDLGCRILSQLDDAFHGGPHPVGHRASHR